MSFLAQLKEVFDGPAESTEDLESRLRFAAAVLMMELTRADREVSDAERDAVRRATRQSFDLTEAEVDELIEAAESEAEAQVSLYRYTDTINTHWSQEDKRRLVECLWRISFAEEGMDRNEEFLVRKLADLLHVPHRVFLQSKLRVQEEQSGS